MKDEKAFGIKRRGSLFRKASKSGSPRRTHTHHAPRHSSAITSPHVKQEMVPEVKKHPHLSATSKSVECFQTKSEKASEDTNEQVSIAPLNIIGTSKEKILSEAALMDQNSSPRLRRRSGDIFSLSPRSSGSRPHSRLFDRTTVDEVAALVEDVVPDTNSIREALEDYAANMGMSVDVSSIFKSKNDVLNGSKFRFCAEIAQLRASRTTATSADELISIYSSNNYSQTSILAQSSQMGSTEYDPQTALPSHLISRQRRSSCDSTGFRSVSSADRPPGSFEGKVRETDLEPTQLLSILDMAEVIKSPSNASPIQTPLTRSRRSSLDVPMARASKAGRPPSRLYEITMHIDDPPIVDESRDSRIETTKPLRCNDNPPNQDLALFTKSTELSKPQEVVQRQAPNVRDSRYRQSAELSLSEHLPSGKLIEGIFPINMDQDTGTPLSILGASISLRKHLHSRQSPDASRRSIASVSSIRPSKLAYSIAVDSSTVNDSGDVQNDPQKAFTPSKYPEYETLHNFSSFAIRAEQSNPLLEGLVTWASIHDEGDSVEEQTQLPFLRPNFSLFRHEDVATSPLPVEDQNIATRSEVAGQTHRPASASENMQVDVKEETSLRKRPNSDGDNVKCRCTLL
ncbi:hypothetical protein BC829DRAFT_396390 [Chytridium lagenaria]|nr:hypothetical protein BC829DRAFT_396390 [Chytridium lagenaria]